MTAVGCGRDRSDSLDSGSIGPVPAHACLAAALATAPIALVMTLWRAEVVWLR